MTDYYMPDVQVEIAFDSGYTTPAADRTWTDVSEYVELEDTIEIDFGRQDERSSADANSLSLTLDNSDGRFTARRAASPYYPNVKVGRPIRVTVTPLGNFCPNGGFETNDTGWATNTALGSYGSATEARSTTRDYAGVASLLITWPTHGTGTWDGFTTADLIPGETYTASCRVWVPTGSPDPRIELLFNTASARTSLKNQWVYLEHTFVAGSGAVEFIGIQVGPSTSGQQCWVDVFMVNRGDVALPYTTDLATPSERFVGFVNDWPVEWDGSDEYARAQITASSRLSRLGLGAKLKSAIEQEILGPGPIGYWTLGDSSGSTTAQESSGANLIGPLALVAPLGGETPPTFGNAIGVASDGLSAFDFPENGLPIEVHFEPTTVRSLRVTFLAQTAGTGGFMLALDGGRTPTSPAQAMTLVYNDPSDVPASSVWDYSNSGLASSAGTAAEGVLHDLVYTSSVADGAARLYIDGVQVDTDTGRDKTGVGRLRLGVTGQPQAYVFCHLAIYDVILTPAQVALQAEAALTGFAGDRTDERVVRILGWAGVPSTEVTVETGVETMTYQLTTGMSVTDALRECESTEGGVLFDGRDGNVTFHNRSHRYTQTPAVTLDMASQHVQSGYRPRVDRSALVNEVTIENPTTEESVRLVDATSADEYGIATSSVTSVAETADDFLERAQWVLASYAEPQTRSPALTVDVLAHQSLTPSAQDLLNLTIGDLIEVENAPTQSDTTTPAYFVEGGTETIGAASYEITFNLSPSSPTADVLMLDSATRGVLDTNLLGY